MWFPVSFFSEENIYTAAHMDSSGGFEYFVKSRFEWELLMLDKQMILYLKALDVGIKICQEQPCISIRDDHATFLVKNTLFKEEVAWQPLKELESCSSSILNPPTRAFQWEIVCLSTIITFEDKGNYVKKCPFLLYEINIFWHSYLYLKKLWW